MIRPAALLLALATAASAGGDRPMNYWPYESRARLAPSWIVDLKPGVPHTFETRNLSKGCDTVLLILDDGRPLAWNDDRERRPKDRRLPAESLLKFTAPRRAPYTLQVRAKSATLDGYCDVYMDGKVLAKKVHFGVTYHRAKRQPMEHPRVPRTSPDVLPDVYELPHADR